MAETTSRSKELLLAEMWRQGLVEMVLGTMNHTGGPLLRQEAETEDFIAIEIMKLTDHLALTVGAEVVVGEGIDHLTMVDRQAGRSYLKDCCRTW